MKVLMVGVSEKRVGGMNTVAQYYKNDEKFNKKVSLKYVSTSTNGTKITRLLYMFYGYIKVIYNLLFFKPDIVHIHMAEKGSVYRKGYVAKISKRHKKKVIIHLHAGPFMAWYDSINEKSQKKVLKIFSYADKVLALGDYWKKELSRIIDEKKISVLYNGVECPNKNNYNSKSKNIIYFGVMKKEKGIYDLLDAIKIIDNKLDKDIKVLLYGNDLVGDVQNKIDELKLNDRVRMMGWFSREQIDEILKNAMINILPSYFEGLSMTIIEGISYGIPTITTNISTMPEILGDYKYMIDPGDINSLSKFIYDLSENENNRLKISDFLYKRSIKLFSIKKQIENTLKIYEEII